MRKRWLILPLVIIVVLLTASAYAQNQAEWTILWYLCGTDLETDDGSATYNLEQAMEGISTDDVNVIIITGGTNDWQNSYVPNDAIGIFRLNSDGSGLTELSHLKDQNMADPGLLGSMIQQVFTLYPADRTMLILWDHGSGSVGGFGYDERTEESISLAELNTALQNGGRHFDVIGFDACLMASLEVANVLAPYADYMVASQELEPGGGWNYQKILAAISKNPAITAAELGKSICDSYLEHCIEWDDKEIATLSLVNLSMVPALTEAFDTMAWQLTGIAENPAAIQAYRQDVNKARDFGGNNRSEGYTHMVDLGELVLNTEGVWGRDRPQGTGRAVCRRGIQDRRQRLPEIQRSVGILSIHDGFRGQLRLRVDRGGACFQGIYALCRRDGAVVDRAKRHESALKRAAGYQRRAGCNKRR